MTDPSCPPSGAADAGPLPPGPARPGTCVLGNPPGSAPLRPVRLPGMARLWFRNATIYAAQVATYHDGNGDGTGDLAGLREKLDYLRGLGVDCLWLLPFYRSPWRDNGYDVSDYYQVDPRFGDLGDMVEFVQAADDRGIKVLIDLVVEHTSDEHPWFRAARSDRDSPYRDYYIWSDDPERDEPVQPMFPATSAAPGRGTRPRASSTGTGSTASSRS